MTDYLKNGLYGFEHRVQKKCFLQKMRLLAWVLMLLVAERFL